MFKIMRNDAILANTNETIRLSIYINVKKRNNNIEDANTGYNIPVLFDLP